MPVTRVRVNRSSLDRFRHTAVAHRGACVVVMRISSRGGICTPSSQASPAPSLADVAARNPFDELPPLLAALHRRDASLTRASAILDARAAAGGSGDDDREGDAYLAGSLFRHMSGFRGIDAELAYFIDDGAGGDCMDFMGGRYCRVEGP